jgi:hypothetical protein
VSFALHTDQLAFHDAASVTREARDQAPLAPCCGSAAAAMQRVVEPGMFHVMIGGNSEEVLVAELTVV